MRKIINWIKEKIKYLTEDIWHIPLADLPKGKSFLVREIRIFTLAIKGFREDKVQIRASALTFNTLLSIIPMLAIAFGIAQSFDFQDRLDAEISNALAGQEEVLNYIRKIVDSFLAESQGGIIAGIGLIVLIWSVMQVLSHIEKSFNHIWEIKKARPWPRKFSDYLTIMIIAPVFLVASGSVTVYINTQMHAISDSTFILGTIKPLLIFLLRFTPFFMMWLVLTLIYMVMPNTRVKFKSALIAAVIAGTVFQFVQALYIDSQVAASKISQIYGSFAAFPLFIVWLQVSWIVVLLGAELSFAHQNVGRYEFESESLSVNSNQKRILTLLILNLIVKRFVNGDHPGSANDVFKELQIPVRLARDILFNLNKAGLVTEINVEQPRERLYQPATDVQKLNLSFILGKIEHSGGGDIPVNETTEYLKIKGILEEFEQKLKKSEMNVLISSI